MILVAAVNRAPVSAGSDASTTVPHAGGRPRTSAPSVPSAPFDLTRPVAAPGPFGLPGDLHFRLGGPLVGTVAEAALGALAARLPGLRAAGPAVRRRRSPVLHGHARLPVAVARTARDLPATAPRN
ncbi:hypothetical protein JHN54_12470 [Streptomyces sp. MBT70]|nr:hypothetical protein [Streptomyces sp. MBT70]